MIIQIGTEVDESRILWKHKESDEWKRADIDDLIEAYEGRQKGEWIDRSGGIEGAWHYCSVCGNSAINNFDFCPNCGAKMKGADDE